MITAVKERPILFSAPMVRALLDGRKTQTRRVVKPQPCADFDQLCARVHWYAPTVIRKDWRLAPGPEVYGFADENEGWKCPHGSPGDRLWVKESFRLGVEWDDTAPRDVPPEWEPNKPDVFYEAGPAPQTGGFGRLRSSIHMPRACCRIVLEVTEVRVEKLHDISEADAVAEGFAGQAEFFDTFWKLNPQTRHLQSLWIWALTFRRVQP